MRLPHRVVADYDLDRPQVQARRRAQPSGTNNPRLSVHSWKDSVEGLFQCVNPIRWTCGMRVLPERDCGDYSVGAHLFPFRTEKLSPTAPMVLPYRWESRSSPNTTEPFRLSGGLFFCVSATATLTMNFDYDYEL